MFTKILIANRGEIACRVIKTARRMGVKTVAVYSDADVNARHVRLADEAVRIGTAEASDSYLHAQRVLDAAKRTGAQAIHPGYGFLSENAEFAEACQRHNIVFIGPPPSAIHAMGSKSAAKSLMESAGVPLTPGYHGDNQAPVFLGQQADNIGYPVLIKASAGGGGKGMRRVDSQDEFAAALTSCKREAMNAFCNDHVLVEKYVLKPRHIEIQVFGDNHGNCVYLFERDCSVQRRHQKVLEEAPAPGMTDDRRAAMGHAAVEAAKAVGYVGAGTVEFIVNQDGNFYFMEMNTRLQVEHPVTEMITGLDLVEWQLRIASNEPLPLSQDQLVLRGHAIEARIYAEEPERGFLPSIGRLVHLKPPTESAHVRIDTGVEQGDDITPYYDPMIAKLIVWDKTRELALERMTTALAAYQIVGVANNVAFLARLVGCTAFATADLDTGLIEREEKSLFPGTLSVPHQVWLLAALDELLREADSLLDTSAPWAINDGWRPNGQASRALSYSCGEEVQLVAVRGKPGAWVASLGGHQLPIRGVLVDGRLHAWIGEKAMLATVVTTADRRHVFVDGDVWPLIRIADLDHGGENEEGAGGLRAPMSGKIVALFAEVGASVEKGTPLLAMEAMKMEHVIKAPANGVVVAYHCEVGEQVSDGTDLVEFVVSP